MSDESTMDLQKMKVADLKRLLKARGLSAVGNKTELIERLQVESDLNASQVSSGDNSTHIGQDILDDSGNNEESEFLDEDDLEEDGLDDDLTSERISETNGAEAAVIDSSESTDKTKSVTGQPAKLASKRKLNTIASKKSDSQSKKFVLNRNTSWSNSSAPEKENETSTNKISDDLTNTSLEVEDTSAEEPQKKVIKLSGLSMKERLEMRAKKFGVQTPESTAAKKEARAIRFGISAASSVPETTTEVLKKRALRFGTATSPILKKTELDEKMKSREERFGVVTVSNKAGLEEKRRLRAERFKLEVV